MNLIPEIEKELLLDKFLKYRPANFEEMCQMIDYFKGIADRINYGLSILNKPIDILNFSVRTLNALQWYFKTFNKEVRTHERRATVGDLVSLNENQLLGIRNFGTTSLREVTEKLERLDLKITSINE